MRTLKIMRTLTTLLTLTTHLTLKISVCARNPNYYTTQVIKSAQRKAFPDEYLALQRQRELPKKTKLLGLRPWLDEEGLMRCDGSLKYAEFLTEDARFPIILPRKNCITKLIVKHYHEKDNHTGGREEIRQWEKECNAKEEKLKLQNKLWPLSHRSDFDSP